MSRDPDDPQASHPPAPRLTAAEIRDRLAALEGENLRLRSRSRWALVGSACALAGALLLCGFEVVERIKARPSRELVVRGLSLVDGHGVERAWFGLTRWGQPSLQFYGRDHATLSLGFLSNPSIEGKSPLIQFSGEGHIRRLSLMLQEGGVPRLDMFDAMGRTAVSLISGENDERSVLAFKHPTTQHYLSLGLLKAERDGEVREWSPFLQSFDGQGPATTMFPSGEK